MSDFDFHDSTIEESFRTVRRQAMRKCCGCFLILAVPVIWILWSFTISHDLSLWRLDRSFYAIQHPAGTKLVDHLREVGLLIGNSNHCDFFVGELRTYSGDKKEIRRFYQHKTMWNPISGRSQEMEIVFFDKDGLPGYQYPELETPSPVSDFAELLKQKHDGKKYYCVYILDVGYPTGLDIRGC